MIRVLVADDNPVIRSGLAGLLDISDRIRVVAQASTGKEAVALARQHRPHVVLLDVRMPVMDGLEAAAELVDIARVLMLTYAEDAQIVGRAVRAGAAGYLVHGRFTPDELVQAVQDVHEGRTALSPAVAPALFEALRDGTGPGGASMPHAQSRLTEREVEVLDLIAQGLSNTEVAQRLYVSAKTVKNHINRAYGKLGVTTRAQAIAAWLGTDDR